MKHSESYHVRPLKAYDIPGLIKVERIVFKEPWPESIYVQELYFNPNAHYFVLLFNGPNPEQPWLLQKNRLIGFVGMRVEIKKGHISTLGLHPKWHRRGLGELLLITALEKAIQGCAESITLEVRVTNHIAQNLYVKYNFSTVTQLHGYYENGEDAYLMQADLLDKTYNATLKENYLVLIKKLANQQAGLIVRP